MQEESVDLFCGWVSVQRASILLSVAAVTVLLSNPCICLPNLLEAHHLEFSNFVSVMLQTVVHLAARVPIVIDTFNVTWKPVPVILELCVVDDGHPTCKGKITQCN